MSASLAPFPARDLLGPDLNSVPNLADQITALDRVKTCGDVEEYVILWLAISDQNGMGGSAFWGNDDHPEAPAAIQTGVHLDDQHAERRARYDALHDHLDTVEGFRPAMERELIRLGRYCDNRRAPLKEVKAVVRAFLATGGKLLLPPQGVGTAPNRPIEASFDTRRFLRGDWSDVDMCAAKAMVRMLRRYRSRSKIERIMRALGNIQNGWLVLETPR